MPNVDRSRSTLQVVLLVGCLVLAAAVFAWGLHAKLSLYGPTVEPSNATVAKLLVNQRSAAALAVPDSHARPYGLWQLLLLLLGSAFLLPVFQLRWIRSSDRRAKPQDYPIPPDLLSRPPPAFALLSR